MSRLKLLALLLAALALPVGLAACGDDDDGGGGDEEAVTEAIQTASTSTDPADCTNLLTANFLEQVGQTVEECEADAADDSDDPDSVEVSEVIVDGDTATADAAFSGGDIDGSTIAMTLVNEDDQWKIDSFDEVVEFNADSVRAGILEQIAADPDLTPEQVACVQGAIEGAADDELEPILLGDSSALEDLVSDC